VPSHLLWVPSQLAAWWLVSTDDVISAHEENETTQHVGIVASLSENKNLNFCDLTRNSSPGF
jgi:hypothetical protein